MHECMHISVYMYVDVHAYMCVRLANDCQCQTETNLLICCEENTYFLPRGKIDFYRGYKFKIHILQVECKSSSRSEADPDLQLRGGQIMEWGVGGQDWGPHGHHEWEAGVLEMGGAEGTQGRGGTGQQRAASGVRRTKPP